jgi:RNA polymerase-binding transcription factor DksA
MDRAQEREQLDRDVALKALRSRIEAASMPPDGAQAGMCIDCEQPIEPARIAALRGCCSRCVECAQHHEYRLPGYRT